MTRSAPLRNPSAIDALGEGISHMRAKLFPFSFTGWLTLGFVGFLESCGSGSGTGYKGNGSSGPSGGDLTGMIETGFRWIAEHMLLVVGVVMVVMVMSLFFMWLRSRTIFVYIDDVATGRFDLVRPWSEHGSRADSFFILSLVVQGAAFVFMVLIFALGVFFAVWARANEWAGGPIALGILPIAFIFLLTVVAAAVLSMVLRDFVAPLQVVRDIGAREAGGVFLSLLSAYPGLLIGYALLKFVLSIAVGILVFIGACFTCCIGAIPVIHQTLFQPIYYAERAWSLKLLAQMGEDVFGKLAPAHTMSRYEDPSDAPTGPIDLSALDSETPPRS